MGESKMPMMKMVLGLDIEVSTDQLKSDIQQVVTRLKASPPDVSIGIKLDKQAQQEANRAMEEITANARKVSKEMNDAGVGSGMKKTADDAKQLSESISNVSKEIENLNDLSKEQEKIAKRSQKVHVGEAISNAKKDYNELLAVQKQLATMSGKGAFSDAETNRVNMFSKSVSDLNNKLIEVERNKKIDISSVSDKDFKEIADLKNISNNLSNGLLKSGADGLRRVETISQLMKVQSELSDKYKNAFDSKSNNLMGMSPGAVAQLKSDVQQIGAMIDSISEKHRTSSGLIGEVDLEEVKLLQEVYSDKLVDITKTYAALEKVKSEATKTAQMGLLEDQKSLSSMGVNLNKSSEKGLFGAEGASDLKTFNDELVIFNNRVSDINEKIKTQPEFVTVQEIDDVRKMASEMEQLGDRLNAVVQANKDLRASAKIQKDASMVDINKDQGEQVTASRRFLKIADDTGKLGVTTAEAQALREEVARTEIEVRNLKEAISSTPELVSQDEIDRVKALQAETAKTIQTIQKSVEARRAETSEELKRYKSGDILEKRMAKNIAILDKLNKNMSDAQFDPANSGTYKRLTDLANASKLVTERFKNGAITTTQYKKAIDSFSKKTEEAKLSLEGAGYSSESFLDRIGGKIKDRVNFVIAAGATMLATQAMREMVSTSIRLDDVMTQLKIVTGDTDSVYQEFGVTVSDTAKRIGVATADLIDSATTYARLGYNLKESTQLAEYTAMLKNVGNIEVGDAQDAITAIVKAFNIDTKDIESVIDKLVITGNEFPISVAQIAEGMNNAASVLAASGNTFEQSVALLTAANTTIDFVVCV